MTAGSPDARRLTDGGVPVSPQAEIAIRHPENGEPLPHGEAGEMCVKAPSAFLGYLENPQATARATTPDGFFRTGDLCRLASPGFVYHGRLGDSLRLSGFLVNPEEIEGFLQQQPGVAAAQVVAAEHDSERVAIAFVCAEPGRRPASGSAPATGSGTVWTATGASDGVSAGRASEAAFGRGWRRTRTALATVKQTQTTRSTAVSTTAPGRCVHSR